MVADDRQIRPGLLMNEAVPEAHRVVHTASEVFADPPVTVPAGDPGAVGTSSAALRERPTGHEFSRGVAQQLRCQCDVLKLVRSRTSVDCRRRLRRVPCPLDRVRPARLVSFAIWPARARRRHSSVAGGADPRRRGDRCRCGAGCCGRRDRKLGVNDVRLVGEFGVQRSGDCVGLGWSGRR